MSETDNQVALWIFLGRERELTSLLAHLLKAIEQLDRGKLATNWAYWSRDIAGLAMPIGKGV